MRSVLLCNTNDPTRVDIGNNLRKNNRASDRTRGRGSEHGGSERGEDGEGGSGIWREQLDLSSIRAVDPHADNAARSQPLPRS